MNVLFLESAISRGYTEGAITSTEAVELLDVITEAFDPYSNKRIREYIDKLTDIRKNIPKEYEGAKETKAFLDKYYDKIVDLASDIEDRPNARNDGEQKRWVAGIISIIGGFTAYLASAAAYAKVADAVDKAAWAARLASHSMLSTAAPAATVSASAFVGPVIGIVVAIIVILVGAFLVSFVEKDVRDRAGVSRMEIGKIRTALKKIPMKKLDIASQHKIIDILGKLDSAEASLKTVEDQQRHNDVVSALAAQAVSK